MSERQEKMTYYSKILLVIKPMGAIIIIKGEAAVTSRGGRYRKTFSGKGLMPGFLTVYFCIRKSGVRLK